MRLTKLFVALCVTAMAFALFGANARAATTSVTVNANTTVGYGPVHVPGNTIPVGMFCPSETFDPNSCPRVGVTTTATGTVTATVTYPSSQQIDLVLCQPAPGGVDLTVDNCPDGTEIACTTTYTVNSDGTTTTNLTCPNVPAGSYELMLVPVANDTCPINPDPLAPPCLDFGPGLDVNGTVSLTVSGGSSQGGGGGTGGTSTSAHVTGGGKINTTNDETFSLEGWDATLTKGQVHYKNHKSCQFRSTQLTVVQVNPVTHKAHFEGKGLVSTRSDEKDATTVNFVADATDGDQGSSQSTGGDMFSISAGYCNGSGPVVNGNIQIHSS